MNQGKTGTRREIAKHKSTRVKNIPPIARDIPEGKSVFAYDGGTKYEYRKVNGKLLRREWEEV